MITYETPWKVESPENVYWYHTMDFAEGSIVIEGDWDLRSSVNDYLGRQNFEGKRCLDIGAANGFLSFAMEKAGAFEVVSFDQSKEAGFNLLPDWEGMAGDSVDRMKRGYWFAHQQYQSNCKAFYGDIYNLPEDLGRFDYAVIGSILLHLENPVGALRQIAKLADRLIVVDVHRPSMETPNMVFRPAFPATRDDFIFWWYIPKETMLRMVQSFWFAIEDCYLFKAGGKACGEVDNYCIVAKKETVQ